MRETPCSAKIEEGVDDWPACSDSRTLPHTQSSALKTPQAPEKVYLSFIYYFLSSSILGGVRDGVVNCA